MMWSETDEPAGEGHDEFSMRTADLSGFAVRAKPCLAS